MLYIFYVVIFQKTTNVAFSRCDVLLRNPATQLSFEVQLLSQRAPSRSLLNPKILQNHSTRAHRNIVASHRGQKGKLFRVSFQQILLQKISFFSSAGNDIRWGESNAARFMQIWLQLSRVIELPSTPWGCYEAHLSKGLLPTLFCHPHLPQPHHPAHRPPNIQYKKEQRRKEEIWTKWQNRKQEAKKWQNIMLQNQQCLPLATLQ